jgi:hypothetical protein
VLSTILIVDNHVPSSKFNRLNHTVGLLLSRNQREVSSVLDLHPHRISLNKKIAEVGFSHEPCPFRQNHVVIHSESAPQQMEASPLGLIGRLHRNL